MARPEEVYSNQYLDELAELNTFLERYVPYFRGPQP